MIVHTVNRVGAFGAMDTDGFGSCSSVLVWTEGRFLASSSTGAVLGPDLGTLHTLRGPASGYGPYRDVFSWPGDIPDHEFYYRRENGRAFVRSHDGSGAKIILEFEDVAAVRRYLGSRRDVMNLWQIIDGTGTPLAQFRASDAGASTLLAAWKTDLHTAKLYLQNVPGV